jgi:hypothetical protein
MRKVIIILVMVLVCISFTNAFSITDSLINSTGLNSTINITGTIYLDTLIIQNDSIYFQNFRSSDGSAYTLTFNLSEYDLRIYDDDLPTFSSTSLDTVVVSSNIQPLDAVITFSARNCNVPSVSRTNSSGHAWLYTNPSCSGGLVTLNVENLGDDTFTIESQVFDMTNLNTSFILLMTLLPLLLGVAIISIFFFFWQNKQGENPDWNQLYKMVLITISCAVLISVGILILTAFK